mmetsp:Transcript_21442/g.38822  ORF Transcript_21442/g.38822 Transcript_21442/m.38822 type:complete len:368 (-) Transcript_21442:44-1147(-)
MTVEVVAEAKPEITKAVARGDLPTVQKIVKAAAAISHDEKIKTINYARKWHEYNLAYKSSSSSSSLDEDIAITNNNLTITTGSSDASSSMEWFDVTPLTTAAMRGHDDIVEYLLRQGADPTLKGCPKDDIIDMLINVDGYEEPLVDLPEVHMNAFDAANRGCRKIRCCRRTQDLLLAIKPYWKRSAYSGSSAMRHKRTVFSNLPLGPDDENYSQGKDKEGCRLGWILDALGEIPRLEDYPLRPKDFKESVVDSSYWGKRKRVDDDPKTDTKTSNEFRPLPQTEKIVEYGQGSGRQRRCSSCGVLKPETSYNKNEKKKGAGARCISCVANNPDLDAISTTKLDDGNAICRPWVSGIMASDPEKKPPSV